METGVRRPETGERGMEKARLQVRSVPHPFAGLLDVCRRVGPKMRATGLADNFEVKVQNERVRSWQEKHFSLVFG
jgi:hypothetical protein